jgi:DNA-binding response OmpR family regulator
MNGSVLIVEDSAQLADMEAAIVQLSGGCPIVVTDGADALSALGEAGYDLIVLDLGLPRVDGQAVLDRLAAEEAWQRIPVIIVSGEIERLRPTPQVVGAFPKPFDAIALSVAIRRALGEEGPAPDADTKVPETVAEFVTIVAGS